MCAIPNKKALKEIHRKTEPFTAWKIVSKRAGAYFGAFQYKPGWNYAIGINPHTSKQIRITRESSYDPDFPVGIHVYAELPTSSGFIVPVTVNPKDIIAAESPPPKDRIIADVGCSGFHWMGSLGAVPERQQFVCTKVFVDPKLWKQSGVIFPRKKKSKEKK